MLSICTAADDPDAEPDSCRGKLVLRLGVGTWLLTSQQAGEGESIPLDVRTVYTQEYKSTSLFF